MKYLILYIVLVLGGLFAAAIGLDICKAFAERNAEINAYRDYYRSAERVLYYGNTDSVPPLVYNHYLDAIRSLDKYREDEP